MEDFLKRVPAEYYSTRLELIQQRIRITQKRLARLAFLRLAVFIITLVLVYFATSWGWTALVVILLAGVTAFLVSVIRYVYLQQKLKHDQLLAVINENETRALAGDYSMFEDGAEYDDHDHPYASDLDIFCGKGVFQYFNRTVTSDGRSRLAGWFGRPLSDPEAISARQAMAAELAEKPGFRQEFMATGMSFKDSLSDKTELLEWVNEPASFQHWKFKFYIIFFPLLTFTLLVLSFASLISAAWILGYVVVPFAVIGMYFKTINKKYGMLTRKSEMVRKYSGLLLLAEKEEFSSDGLVALKKKLEGHNGLPSLAVKHLSAILNAFDARNNLLMGFILNFLFLWDMVQVMRLEHWQAKHREELPKWLEVVTEIDTLNSLANFYFNHPGSNFPRVSDEGALLIATDMGHPLIPDSRRIDNPASIPRWRHFTIITGANMAGKSTYLRTVGVNLVLAMMGSAVIAKEMAFQPTSLVTSIRMRDSLQKNESYFYAELKRLQNIIERLQAGEKLIILLDEILKGTNSRDKQSGSFALLEKFLNYNASGFVATHDLALGEMEKDHPEHIVNKSFEVVIENDLLAFDYKLKDGIARQMNATYLMKKMGITD